MPGYGRLLFRDFPHAKTAGARCPVGLPCTCRDLTLRLRAVCACVQRLKGDLLILQQRPEGLSLAIFSCARGALTVGRRELSCDIHTHTPAQKKYIQTSSCTSLSYRCAIQTVLGMGMGMNVTAKEQPGVV